jgi:hypothetical protein
MKDSNGRKVTISIPKGLSAFAARRVRSDYLSAGSGYRRSLSGYIQWLIAKDRTASEHSGPVGQKAA